MRLSYLDILLGTTMVFVIIYGVYSRSDVLPEMEGAALVLRVNALPAPHSSNSGEPAFTIIYATNSGDRNEVLLDSDSHRLSEFLLVDASRRREGWIAVHGQPDPGSTIEVRVTRQVDRAKTYLLDHCKFYDAQARRDETNALSGWAQDGESLLFRRSSMSTDDYQREVIAWKAGAPLVEGALRDRVLDNYKNYYATSWFDAAARALMVSELISPTHESLDTLFTNTRGRFRDACGRVMRYWHAHYGALSAPLTDNNWGLTPPALPEVGELPIAPRDSWQRAITADSWGTWVVHDLVADQLSPPVHCFWSYGGKPRIAIGEWQPAGPVIACSVPVCFED
jgi:hypothetical protein